MLRFLAIASLTICSAWAYAADTMTYDRAQQLFQPGELPKFWVGDVDGLAARYDRLEAGKWSSLP